LAFFGFVLAESLREVKNNFNNGRLKKQADEIKSEPTATAARSQKTGPAATKAKTTSKTPA
jgi:hypothetical protein